MFSTNSAHYRAASHASDSSLKWQENGLTFKAPHRMWKHTKSSLRNTNEMIESQNDTGWKWPQEVL